MSFQQEPRNSFRLPCALQTRPSLAVPKPSEPLPGILDMTFNRRSLDWSELEIYSPHSTCSNRRVNPPPADSQSTADIYHQLSRWNFPPQPSVPPRLVLWGPFNKTAQHHFQCQQPAFSAQGYRPLAPYPLTPPSHGCKAPKRGRDGYLPSPCLSLATPAAPSKRPRTAEQAAYRFPPAAYQTSAHPSPATSPTTPSQSPTFHNHHWMAEESLSTSPFSSSPGNFPQASPTEPKRFYFRDPSPAYSELAYLQHSYSSSSTCNYGYYPNSPISPTTPPSLSPLSTNSSPFHTAYNNGSHQLALQNPQCHNAWAPEWHQAFNQFRYQKHAN